jgi:PadR family transcriptional regulator
MTPTGKNARIAGFLYLLLVIAGPIRLMYIPSKLFVHGNASATANNIAARDGVLGPQHGYGIARRIEQISGDLLAMNQGTLYSVLLKLEQEGAIASEWGASENNRRARFYRLTREGRKQLQVETQDWEQTAAIIARFFEVKAEDLS